jgi:hypothetical protein
MSEILAALLVFLGITLGFVTGWLSNERYTAFISFVEHDHEELFQKNPHPELYDDEGNLNRGEYMHITFDPGYNPDEFDPEDIIEE